MRCAGVVKLARKGLALDRREQLPQLRPRRDRERTRQLIAADQRHRAA
jgi:hypothetical protein